MRPAVIVATVALLLGGCSVLGGGGGDRPEGVVRVGIVQPQSLDPIEAATVEQQIVADQRFDALVALDPVTAEPGPGVAASWTVSDDGLTWDFTLGEATFASGAPITAADVKATLDRAVRERTRSVVADLLEPVVGWSAIAVDGTAAELAGVAPVSDDVVRVVLSSPWSSLPAALAHPGLGVVPAATTAVDDSTDGSGPLTVASVDDERVVLRAAKGREMRAKGIELYLFDDQAAAYEAFVEGDVDVAPVPMTKVEEAAARFGREHFRSYAAELYYAFNLRNPKWADRRLREAVVSAVDRQAIIDDVYGGGLRPMTALVPTGLPGASTDACGDACVHDAEKAKALLAEVSATGAALPEIAIDFEGDEVQQEVASRIAADLAAVGLTVSLRPKPVAEYEAFSVSGEQDLFRLGWVAPYAAADAFVAPVFASRSANNLPGYSSIGLDALVVQARAATDGAARADLYEQADRLVMGDLPILPIGHFQQHWVAADDVRDLRVSVTGTFDASALWLADD